MEQLFWVEGVLKNLQQIIRFCAQNALRNECLVFEQLAVLSSASLLQLATAAHLHIGSIRQTSFLEPDAEVYRARLTTGVEPDRC